MGQVKKILFVAMPSIHFIRWIKNIPKDTYELYWFDVLDRGYIDELSFLHQIVGWKKRKVSYIKGEYFLRKKLPFVYKIIESKLQVTVHEKFKNILETLRPDMVHSFEMQSCSYPITKAMSQYKNIKWLYSCWGSDLYYYKDIKNHLNKIQLALYRINFLHTDCLRDYSLAKQLGFNGEHAGVIPGGGGYFLEEFNKYKTPFKTRKIIVVKGYQHKFGRALNVIKALELVIDDIINYKVVVFGTHNIVKDYIKVNDLPFKVYDRQELSHEDVMMLMGQSKIYIGNNISDGMPNTLLEAIIMGVFPVQSNPGGVTEEIIQERENGCLINNPNNILEIKEKILAAIKTVDENESYQNDVFDISKLSAEVVRKKIKGVYKYILS